ncbi:MAG: flagellar protein FlaG [Halioglobus sp.]|nr:flagellar protein FlaG [Halioglobus sp.]
MQSFKTGLVMVPVRAVTVGPTAAPVAVSGRQDLVNGGKQSPQQRYDASSPAGMREAVAIIEQSLGENARSLRFEVDEKTGKDIVTVMDTNTGEVIRQIPAKEIVATARFIGESLDGRGRGVLLNTES